MLSYMLCMMCSSMFILLLFFVFFFFSSRRRHTRCLSDWSSDVCSSDLKKQAQDAVREAAKACGQFYVTERWLGGTLTNFATIKRSIGRLKEIEKMEADRTINQYVKQEQSMLRREAARLVKYFDGIRSMDKF